MKILETFAELFHAALELLVFVVKLLANLLAFVVNLVNCLFSLAILAIMLYISSWLCHLIMVILNPK